jgi:metal-responsive CopG/Arc/MetJ family transcriptional regulator
MGATKQFSIKLPTDLYEYVEKQAKEKYTSKSQIIIQMLVQEKNKYSKI